MRVIVPCVGIVVALDREHDRQAGAQVLDLIRRHGRLEPHAGRIDHGVQLGAHRDHIAGVGRLAADHAADR